DAREQNKLVDDQRRLAAARLRRLADRADDIAEVHVNRSRSCGRTEQLDAPRTVDEIEEDELPHVAARHHAAGEPARLRAFDAVRERVRLLADGGDLVAVGESLRRAFAHGRLTIAQACGPSFGVSPSLTTSKPCRR